MSKKNKFIAMLGGGQLGLMFTIKAHLLGKKVLVLDPDKNCPAGKIADKFINKDYLDINALNEIKENCNVCTTEFENIPFRTLEILEKDIEVFPNSKSLKVSQDRILEKKFLRKLNLPTTEYHEINSKRDLEKFNINGNWPYILKTSTFGYDGKGQKIVNNFSELKYSYEKLNSDKFVLEKKVNLKKEVSQVAACYKEKTIFLPISENIHINNILHKSIIPANIDNDSVKKIEHITKEIVNSLKYIGIICVEFFIDDNDNIMVNEIAPRTHNSGHYSMDGCDISQFEHQVRILTNMDPKGSSVLLPSVMINLLGDLWKNGPPDFSFTENDNIFLHLYNKDIPKPGRKMGHINILDASSEFANELADKFFKELNEK